MVVVAREAAPLGYAAAMSVGTQGPYRLDDPKRHSQYFHVLREASGKEVTQSILLEPEDLWARDQLRLLVLSALSRTQGPIPDQVRVYVGPIAGRLGRPVAKVETTTADIVGSLRERTGLPASEVAHMLGVQRRQLYKILEGGSTTSEREARILAIDGVLTELHSRYDDVSTVRSCLLAPLDDQLRSFIDIAEERDVQTAWRALSDYLEQRGNRPVPLYIERPQRSKRRRDVSDFVRSTRDIAPGR
jgi:transcriptional regulator with XRE-family HTH domain